MKQLTIGIFHDDSLANELGKKATESDMVLYHRKLDDSIYSFIHPVDDKLTVKTQILGIIDAVILSAENITPSFGETLLMIDAMKLKYGFIVVPAFSDTSAIKEMIKDTSLNHFEIIERDVHKIMEKIQEINLNKDHSLPAIVTIDHSFPVKGIGEVVLGFIKQGTIHTHDKLNILPNKKEIIVRSIQMMDKDEKEAAAGSRVGLAIKGAHIDELVRGRFLCKPESAQVEQNISLNFSKNKFYPTVEKGKFHVTVGMQTIPITITEIKDNYISFSADKPFCFTKDEVFLLLNLNAEKLHFIGSGIWAEET